MNPGKPDVDEKLATDLAYTLYGFRVLSIEQMVSYDDRNFHIKVSNEHCNPNVTSILPAGYTLKTTNPLKSAINGHFDSMHGFMKHACGKGLHFPLPVPNLEGKTWSIKKIPLVQSSESETNCESPKVGLCGIHLLTYIEGVPVSTIDCSFHVLNQWGNLLAQLHNALQDFSDETLNTKEVFWDMEHVPEISNFMNGLDKEKSDLVLDVLKNYPQEVTPLLPFLTRGYIHGDFNENNVLARKMKFEENEVSKEAQWCVDGILDLEDAHLGTYAWDVAVMLAYASMECKTVEPIDGMGHVLAGYLQLRQLSEKEISVLKILTASRLCQSLVMGTYFYKIHPENPYLITSTRNGWIRLRHIWDTTNEHLLDRWKCIRSSYANKVPPS